jgi:hypothetical protein
MLRTWSGVCSPARGVPGIKYLPMSGPPTTTARTLSDEPRSGFDGLITCDRHADPPGIFVRGGHACCGYRVECTNDEGAWQQVGVEEPGALFARLIGDIAVALRKRIAGIDDDFSFE